MALNDLQRFGEAEEAWEKALQLNPKLKVAQANLDALNGGSTGRGSITKHSHPRRRQAPRPSHAGDRALGLRHAVRASAKISELRHRVDRLVAVNPSDEHRRLAEPRQLAHPQARGRHLAAHVAFACVAQTSAAQILEREDAVVAVDPLHADGVAPYFVQAFYLRSL